MTTAVLGNDVDGLSIELATEAFRQLGENEFTVSANLSNDHPESIRNFQRFREILMMAYQRGVSDAQMS